MVAARILKAKCAKCGREYALLGQVKLVERKLKPKTRSTEYLNLCPECRRLVLAEKMKAIALMR